MKTTHTKPDGYDTPEDVYSKTYYTPNTLMHALCSFEGRINRGQFWVAEVVIFATIMATVFVLELIGELIGEAWVFFILLVICAFWSNLAILTKRCHDCNWSGGWTLLVIFLFPLGHLFLGCWPGTQGRNRFGN